MVSYESWHLYLLYNIYVTDSSKMDSWVGGVLQTTRKHWFGCVTNINELWSNYVTLEACIEVKKDQICPNLTLESLSCSLVLPHLAVVLTQIIIAPAYIQTQSCLHYNKVCQSKQSWVKQEFLAIDSPYHISSKLDMWTWLRFVRSVKAERDSRSANCESYYTLRAILPIQKRRGSAWISFLKDFRQPALP